MQHPFFNHSDYFIDQKVNMFRFGAAFKIFDGLGQEIGAVHQPISGGQKFLRILINKSVMPFHLDIKDLNGQVIATLKRGWTFFMSEIAIYDQHGAKIGFIRQKFKLFKPKFFIHAANGEHIATIAGDWTAWNFTITDENEKMLGKIDKKWAGAMKEMFTSADKYTVQIDPKFENEQEKTIILAAALTIDMVLKENK